jgi:hypothetical protein
MSNEEGNVIFSINLFRVEFPLHLEYAVAESKPLNIEIGNEILRADNVVARYAADLPPALKNISFTLHSGE